MYVDDWLSCINGAYNSYNSYRFDWYDLRDKLITDSTLLEIRDNLRGIYYIFENLFSILPPPVFNSIWYEHVKDVGQGAALTMPDILDTMLLANPDEVMSFVGIVDAYRQSVWNSPFNKEFFAALGRGFMIWP